MKRPSKLLNSLQISPGPTFACGAAWGALWLVLDTSAVFLRRLTLASDLKTSETTLDLLVYFSNGAFFPLLLGLSVAVGARAWQAAWRAHGSTAPSLWSFLWTDDSAMPGRSAFGLTVLAVIAVACLIGVPAIGHVQSSIRTPRYAAIASYFVAVAALLLAVTVAPILWKLLKEGLKLPGARANARLLSPGGLLTLGLVALQLGGLVLVSTSRRWADGISWVYVFAPALSLTVMVTLGHRFAQNFYVASKIAVPTFLVLGVLAATAPSFLQGPARRALSEPGLATTWVNLASDIADIDGDHASGIYGISDCGPLDARIYPGALETANNGIDEDCDGSDFSEPKGGSLLVSFPPPRRPERLASRPDIFLITTDSLSASRTGLGGSKTNTTPELDAWAKRATTFSAAFSVSNATYAAIPTLLTGLYASEIPSLQKGTSIAPYFTDPRVLLPVMLRAEGYETVALLGDNYFSEQAWPSLADAFDTFSLKEYELAKKSSPGGAVHAAPFLTERAISEVRRKRRRPLFLWVHYFDHHNPHEPRKEWISDINPAQTEAERFDQELHFADRHWGKLLQEIESSRAAEGYVTIFTADHGEAFDKNHPSEHHKFSLHGEELHVPLVIQTYAQRGHTYRDIVSHLDLVPTLGTLADFQPPLEGEGENLVGALFFGTPPQKRALYSLFYSVEFLRYGSDPFRQIGIRTDQHYLVSDLENRRQYLAAWRTDPLEEADLRQREPGLTGQLTYYLNRQLAELRKDHRAFVDGQEKRR